MVEGFYKRVTKILTDNGWVRLPSSDGYYEQWWNELNDKKLKVRRALSCTEGNEILKRAGIGERVHDPRRLWKRMK